MTKLEELELTELKELKAELLVLTSMAKGDIRAWAVDEISRIEAIVKLKEQDDAAAVSAAYHAVYHPSTASWAYANAELELSNYLKEQDK
tara:strand:- start:339 stop:608 length:270 start_codon:yes stop_codon:yes gene_type:complete